MPSYALIMAGGGGTRLWPASRRESPKQFLPLLPGGQTLLGATVERLLPVIPAERIMVVTARSQVAEVRRTAPAVPESNIVVEPQARNTAACIGLGALAVLARDPDAQVAVVPSDQYARDLDAYRAAVEQALAVAAQGGVVTVGLKPNAPETGFGYLELGAALNGAQTGAAAGASRGPVHEVARFVEKPDRATAQRYLQSGQYLWNSGMFFFRAERILRAIRQHLPALGEILDEIGQKPERTDELYPKAQAVSIDYGVMERLAQGEVYVVPADFGWSDVGAWSALPAVLAPDAAGNVAVGEHIAIDARNNVLYAEGGRLVAALGVEGLVIVATAEAVLVLPRERAQDVKEIVRALETSRRHPYL